jgi:hypothetical protein
VLLNDSTELSQASPWLDPAPSIACRIAESEHWIKFGSLSNLNRLADQRTANTYSLIRRLTARGTNKN